ncbi:MAG: ABC transporter permease [Vicinamibacterales bacterium]
MFRDLRHAVRSLRRTPWFTATAIVILALAVGAATAVFSLLYALVLRPLPVPGVHELVQVTIRDTAGRTGDLTWRQFREFSRNQQVFSALLASLQQSVLTVETEQASERASVSGVSGNYFVELGAEPTLGRLIGPSDDDLTAMTAAPVAVISWTFWQRRYAGDPAVIGRSIKAEGVPLTIIGIAPRGFLGLGITIEPDISIPISLMPELLKSEASMVDGTSSWVATTGRLLHGVTLESARAQIEAMWPRVLSDAAPEKDLTTQRKDYFARRVVVESGAFGVERGLRSRYAQPLYALLAIATLVWFTAAANLCSLIFTRTDARRHELGVRLALGSSRARLIRELTAEGLLLGCVGTVTGLVFAAWASRGLTTLLLQDYAVRTSLDVGPDRIIVGVAAVGGIGMAVAVTALAASIVTRSHSGLLSPGGTRTLARSSRVGKVLVGVQVALSIVLLTHTALLVRNVYGITTPPTGMTNDPVVIAFPTERVGAYKNLNPAAYYPQAIERVLRVPGVTAAAFSSMKPEGGSPAPEPVGRVGTATGENEVTADWPLVSPGFFTTVGVSIVRGRDFTYADNESSRRVTILSQSLERRLFGEGRGMGEHVRISRQPGWQDVAVVGIASDARVYDVRRGNMSIAYTPSIQSGARAHYKFLVARAPASASAGIEQAIDALGFEFIHKMQTLEYVRGRTILQERVMATVGGFFGVLALLLVSAGVYGLLSYALSLRRKEIGIRMALGARARGIGQAMLVESLMVTIAGISIGLIGAVASVRLLAGVLVAIGPFDPVAMGGACVMLLGVTTIGALAPAIRAARVEPLSELRRD